jgi:allantoinase
VRATADAPKRDEREGGQGRDREAESLALRVLARWMSEAPARLAGLDDRKGRVAAGYDADLVVWDPDVEWTVDSPRLQQRHKVTPYEGRRLVGRVQTTFLRGTPVWRDGRLVTAGSGRLL